MTERKPKSETRNPKEIRSPKFESDVRRTAIFSDFGLGISFGFLVSDFGIDFAPCHFRHSSARTHRSARSIAAVLIFLIIFSILLILVSRLYLQPTITAAQGMDHKHRRLAAARALLTMSVLLTILLVGLLATFRFSRFFFPRPDEKRTKTKVVDAWAEAGKRIDEKSGGEDQ